MTTEDELTTRLAAAVAVHKRRQQLKAMARGELSAARSVGLARRHTERLRRIRGDQREENTVGEYESPDCPDCGQRLEETDTEVDPWARYCANPACERDK